MPRNTVEKFVYIVQMSDNLRSFVGNDGVEIWYNENVCEAIRSDQGAFFPDVTMTHDDATGLFKIPYTDVETGEPEVIILQDLEVPTERWDKKWKAGTS